MMKTKPDEEIKSPKIVEILNGIVEKLVNIFNHKLINFFNVYLLSNDNCISLVYVITNLFDEIKYFLSS